MTRAALRAVFAALLLNATACVSVTTPRFMQPAPEREWSPTLNRAQSLAANGRVLEADSLLARYASSFPGTEGAAESYYWRALMLVQAGASPAPGPASLLQTYLKETHIDHRIEAEALLKAASTVDSLTRAASALATKVTVSNGEVVNANAKADDAKATVKVITADTKDQDAEIKRLKDELAKSKEELERIKKRLAEPPKKPPHG